MANFFTHKYKILFGLVAFSALLIIPTPPGLTPAAWHTVAIIGLMLSWWSTEAIPIAATALLPIILFPLLDVTSIKQLASAYGNPIIFLFLGGFMIALATEKVGLHRRFALHILKFTGTKPHRIMLGFIICTAFLSMWISNTATTIMMLPIALSVLDLKDNDNPAFATGLMLAIAYSASIGGIATLIGTPPNAFFAAYLQQSLNHTIDFGEWMLVALPLVIILLFLLFILLAKFIFKLNFHAEHHAGYANKINIELQRLGKLSKAEKYVAAVFILTALLWLTNRWLTYLLPGINNTSIAIFGALLLFFSPRDKQEPLVTFATFNKLPWDILLLFGGGLSIAFAVGHTGLNTWLAAHLQFTHHVPAVLLIAIISFSMVFITEIMSNTAAIATFLPIITILAGAAHIEPLRLLIPATFSVSCAFMLPIATPPNAIVYASRRINMNDMMRTGFVLNMVFSVVISLYGYFI